MTDENVQKEMQQKLMLFQSFQAQLEEMARQAETVQSRVSELKTAEETLGDINRARADSEVLVPLGGGCYGYGKLSDRENFMVEIGAGLAKKKGLKGAKALVEKKKKEVEDIGNKIDDQMKQMRSSMDKIGLELQQMSMKAQKEEDGAKGGGDITVD